MDRFFKSTPESHEELGAQNWETCQCQLFERKNFFLLANSYRMLEIVVSRWQCLHKCTVLTTFLRRHMSMCWAVTCRRSLRLGRSGSNRAPNKQGSATRTVPGSRRIAVSFRRLSALPSLYDVGEIIGCLQTLRPSKLVFLPPTLVGKSCIACTSTLNPTLTGHTSKLRCCQISDPANPGLQLLRLGSRSRRDMGYSTWIGWLETCHVGMFIAGRLYVHERAAQASQ
jgi:hypothetical protein